MMDGSFIGIKRGFSYVDLATGTMVPVTYWYR